MIKICVTVLSLSFRDVTVVIDCQVSTSQCVGRSIAQITCLNKHLECNISRNFFII